MSIRWHGQCVDFYAPKLWHMSLGISHLDLIQCPGRTPSHYWYKIISFDLDPLNLVCRQGVQFPDGDMGVPEAGQVKRIVSIEDRQCLGVELAASEAEAEGVLRVPSVWVFLELELRAKDERDAASESVVVYLVAKLGGQTEQRR
jgi:hypothetical protein